MVCLQLTNIERHVCDADGILDWGTTATQIPTNIQSSSMPTILTPRSSSNIRFKEENGEDDSELTQLRHHNEDLQRKLNEASRNVESLKHMLVQSFSDRRKKRRNAWDESAKVKKVCREVIWKDVKFAPDSAYVQFGSNSIFRKIVDNCNLSDGTDEIVFWGNNREVVKASLNEHRSNVTSRIKHQFKIGEKYD